MSTQTAAARRTAEAKLGALITEFAPDHKRLVGATRKWVRKRLPTAHELVYEYSDCIVISFSPSEHGYEGVLAIRASADEVRLYFNNGKGLPDPEKLLQGTAKLVRWIHVEAAPKLARPAVAALADAAIERNRVPFARTGTGSVIIRSEVARKRK